MDPHGLYNSEDNSNILDNNGSAWIMQNNAVLVDSDNVVWHDNGPEITVNYSEITEQTLTESDGYVTCDCVGYVDGDNEENGTSQYFSILSNNADNEICTFNSHKYETSEVNSEYVMNVEVEREEVILPDITKVENLEDEERENNDIEDQVILYQIDGSNELYAEQVADDGSGQLKTYRYKVRRTSDGQYEAVPGSIEVHDICEGYMYDKEYVAKEFEHNIKEELVNISTEDNEELRCDIKDITVESVTDDEIKYSVERPSTFDELHSKYISDAGEVENDFADSDDLVDEERKMTYEKSVGGLSSVESGNSESEYEIEELEEDFQDDYIIKSESCDTNLSEMLNDTFQCKDEQTRFSESQTLKPAVEISNVNVTRPIKQRSYLFINMKEKENMSLSHSVDNAPVHFKSILKNNFVSSTLNCTKQKPIELSNSDLKDVLNMKEVSTVNENKENNTVAVKSARQPRKQRIIPVERAGSEIIVQPLIYALVDNHTDVSSKRTRVTNEIYQVSDESDPEFTLKPIKKKRNKRGRHSSRTNKVKPIEITISDTDDENGNENCIINLLSDQENSLSAEEANNIIEKKKESKFITDIIDESRKQNNEDKILLSSNIYVRDGVEDTSVPLADAKVNHELKKKTVNKNNIKCPMCPKTFPRQANLKSHMNIHNARRVLRSKIMTRNKASIIDRSSHNLNGIKYDSNTKTAKKSEFTCEECHLKFQTETQLTRHYTVHTKSDSLPDVENSTRIHEKHHNNTKQKSRIKTRNIQTSCIEFSKKKNKEFRCKYCNKLYYDKLVRDTHENVHKTYSCVSCETTFTAKLLLDKHVQRTPCKRTRKKLFNVSGVKCLLCKKVFCSAETLKKHTILHHNTQVGADKSKKKPKKKINLM